LTQFTLVLRKTLFPKRGRVNSCIWNEILDRIKERPPAGRRTKSSKRNPTLQGKLVPELNVDTAWRLANRRALA
jgi:hypothetical protein